MNGEEEWAEATNTKSRGPPGLVSGSAVTRSWLGSECGGQVWLGRNKTRLKTNGEKRKRQGKIHGGKRRTANGGSGRRCLEGLSSLSVFLPRRVCHGKPMKLGQWVIIHNYGCNYRCHRRVPASDCPQD